MNIVNRLTLRHMKLNKKRTIVTTIAIIIAVAMLTAVSTISYSILDYFGRTEMKYTANMHVKFEGYQYGDTDKIKNKLDVEAAYITKIIGNYELLDTEINTGDDDVELDIGQYYVQVTQVEKSFYDMLNIDLVEGKYAESGDEVVLSYSINNLLGGKDIGDKVTFGDKLYTIVGIAADEDYDSNEIGYDLGMIFPVWTYFDTSTLTSSDIVNGYFLSRQISSHYIDEVNELEKELSNGLSESVTAYPNWNVLTYYGHSKFGNIDKVMNSFKTVLIAIIVISSIALISNAFIISISERSRYLGMLASIGATKKQKRMSVYFEGFVEGVIGIAVGIASGFLGMYVTFKCIQPLIDSLTMTNIELRVIVNWNVIITSIIVSIVTIAISAYIPARRASKITAIDAIRQSKDIKISNKTVKTLKITRKIFGFEGELALKNLKRNKKRYRITIFSLFISITLFLVVFAYVSFIKQQYLSVYGNEIDYDIRIEMIQNTCQIDEEGNITYDDDVNNIDIIESNISNNKYIDKMNKIYVYEVYDNEYTFDPFVDLNNLKKYYDDKYKEFVEKDKDIIEEYRYSEQVNFIVMDEKYLSKFLEKNGYNYNDFVSKTNNVIILNNIRKTIINDDEILKYGNKIFDSSIIGNQLELLIEGNNYDTNEAVKRTLNFNVYALVNDMPFGFSDMNGGINIIITPDYVKNYSMMLYDKTLIIKTNDNDKFMNVLETVMDDNDIKDGEQVSVVNFVEVKKELDNVVLLISVFAYGFIILMTLICVANIFNTISTSFSLRRREFAMLRSVGMTSGAFHKMIAYESAFYGLKALLFGLPLSTLIILYLKNSITQPFAFEVSFPWMGYAIAIFGVFFTIGITMLYSAKKIKKQNVIETLRDENI